MINPKRTSNLTRYRVYLLHRLFTWIQLSPPSRHLLIVLFLQTINPRVLRQWREALDPYKTLLCLQDEISGKLLTRPPIQPHGAHKYLNIFAGFGISSLPVSLVRAICQSLSHADIEQCRLVCQSWRRGFGEASVTDLYMVG